MADARGNFFWQQTSTLEALQINMNRAKNAKSVHPDELNPYAVQQRKKSNRIEGKAAWSLFKTVVENTMKSQK